MALTGWLLDGNVLVALVLDQHAHHRRVKRWLEPLDEPFATCPITQGTLLRLHMKLAADPSPAAAWAVLESIVADPLHVFWDDGFSYLEVNHSLLQGPRQVTDGWLVALARRRGGRVATLDQAMVTLYPDLARLVPLV